jgi:hypothetical protein
MNYNPTEEKYQDSKQEQMKLISWIRESFNINLDSHKWIQKCNHY